MKTEIPIWPILPTKEHGDSAIKNLLKSQIKMLFTDSRPDIWSKDSRRRFGPWFLINRIHTEKQ